MTNQERIERGQRAAFLLRQEAFKAAAEMIDQHMRDAVFRTALSETEKREALFAEYSGFRRVVALLKGWVDDGELAAAEEARGR